jgi:hypothetical protein
MASSSVCPRLLTTAGRTEAIPFIRSAAVEINK